MRREIIRNYGSTGHESEDHSLFFSATEGTNSDEEEGLGHNLGIPMIVVNDVDKGTNKEKLLPK